MTAPAAGSPVLEMTGVTKQYAGLRPLRITSLTVGRGERIAISGLDAGAAEVFVNLATGASLPDAGQVVVLGQTTAAIANGDEWLTSLDRFGIMSPRAVLLEAATALQNLAMPFTLAIDEIPLDVLGRIESLAGACGIPADALQQPVGAAPPAIVARVHFGRAIALDPDVLILEHPTAAIPEAERAAFAADVARVCEARSQTLVAVTMDKEFASAVAHRALALHPATGALSPLKRRGWFW
jgi:ABC-type lipoprotein export system ATPase subunit